MAATWRRAPSNSFDDLANATTQWSAGGAIEREVLDKSEKNYDFNIVRCKYAEMYKELGLADMGFIFSCGRDGSMYSGFNEKIKLERTQTIMQGAAYCDFRLSIDEEAVSDGKANAMTKETRPVVRHDAIGSGDTYAGHPCGEDPDLTWADLSDEMNPRKRRPRWTCAAVGPAIAKSRGPVCLHARHIPHPLAADRRPFGRH